MSHPEQIGFVRNCRDFLANAWDHPDLIEIGSYDVNKPTESVRGIFRHTVRYVGVDLTEGPGVDLIASGHELDLPDESFDIALSSECFEHNPFWAETFSNMHRLLRPGGLLIMTCATTGRVEHGTARTDPNFSPGTSAKGWSYYRNLTQADFESCFTLSDLFQVHRFYTAKTSHDLYFVGFKPGPVRSIPAAFDAAVNRLDEERRRLMPAPVRLARAAARAPLGILARMLPEPTFQNVAVPYSQALMKIGSRLRIRV